MALSRTFRFFLAVFAGMLIASGSAAQIVPPADPGKSEGVFTPPHMWEFGLHGGASMLLSDIDYVPNWGVGFHVRRALDYVFSVRADAFHSTMKNQDEVDGTTETTVQAGSLQIIVSLNNLIWNNEPRRKVNLYGLVGAGVTRFSVDVKKAVMPNLKSVDPLFQSHADAGAGVSFRVSERFNLGFETKALVAFGANADMFDGTIRRERDVVTYSSLRFNFNLGSKTKRVEPLYWVNPMQVFMEDITELKKRPVLDLTDTDGDGVIDMLDQDNSTPPGLPVDTKGKLLDSDGDGIPNHEDQEPYIPAGTKYAIEKDDKPYVTEEQLREVLKKDVFAPIEEGTIGTEGVANWFLPMIHFNIDSDELRHADYGNLASVAEVMNANTRIKVLVTGFTDKTASEAYNLGLSYRRAKAAIDYLAISYRIPRNRFVLNYNGEDNPLVPSLESSIMNRRVEFRVATKEDINMQPPEETGKRKKK